MRIGGNFRIQPQSLPSTSLLPTSRSPNLGPLTFSFHELTHALFATGRWNDWAIRRFRRRNYLPRLKITRKDGMAVVLKFLKSWATLRLYVEPPGKPSRRNSDLFLRKRAYDEEFSQRRHFAEDFGLAMTGIYCYKNLDVVQLLHEENSALCFDVIRGDKQPDLIGINNDGYAIIAEAKGSTSARITGGSTVVKDAIHQLCSVSFVGLKEPLYMCHRHRQNLFSASGQCSNCRRLQSVYNPYKRVGCISTFESKASAMKLFVLEPDCPSIGYPTDPDATDEERLDDSVATEQLARFYTFLYSTIHSGLSLTSSSVENWDGPELRVLGLPDIGLSFGMLAEVHNLVEDLLLMDDEDSGALVDFADNIRSELSSATFLDALTDPRLFRDGTFFQADWLEDMEAAND